MEYQILIEPDPDQYRVFRGRIREVGLTAEELESQQRIRERAALGRCETPHILDYDARFP
jgi:hypothetical protein